jgi:hypothetical protein
MIDATHIELFDNGSQLDPTGPLQGQTADMCPSPGDPSTRVARPQTRVVTYALDTQAHTATLRQSYQVDGRYAPFAGNWQNEPNGDRVIGWSQSQQTSGTPPIATEIGPGGNELWAVQSPGWFSYRVFKFPAPDVQDPTITTAGLTDGQTLDESDPAPVADFACTDTGGSSLASCAGTVANGQPLPLSPGAHQQVVTATDGAGNTTTRTLHYTVLADHRPDARIRLRGGPWVGGGVVGSARTQTVHAGLAPRHAQRLQVSVRNAGTKADRIEVCGSPSTSRFSVRYLRGGVDVTRALVRCWRTPSLAPGATTTLDVVIRNVAAPVGARHTFQVTSTSVATPTRRDAVAAAVTGTR